MHQSKLKHQIHYYFSRLRNFYFFLSQVFEFVLFRLLLVSSDLRFPYLLLSFYEQVECKVQCQFVFIWYFASKFKQIPKNILTLFQSLHLSFAQRASTTLWFEELFTPKFLLSWTFLLPFKRIVSQYHQLQIWSALSKLHLLLTLLIPDSQAPRVTLIKSFFLYRQLPIVFFRF